MIHLIQISVCNCRLFKDALSQYAFCEYEEPEMASRAIHRLSNYAIAGQVLRADIAAGNRSAEEVASKNFIYNNDTLNNKNY